MWAERNCLSVAQAVNEGVHFKGLLAMYTKALIAGINLRGIELRAESIKGYLLAANSLFAAKGYPEPVDLSDPDTCPSANFYKQIRTWEKEPNRRTHMTPEFLQQLITQADATADKDSFVCVVVDWTIMARYAAFRICEVGQKTQSRIEYHEVKVTGRRIMMAFARGDFVFLDIHDRQIFHVEHHRELIRKCEITWRVQKNRRNGQKITWMRDTVNPRLCMVEAAIRIHIRSLRYDIPGAHPLGFYIEKGRMKYITGRKISAYFKDVAQIVYPGIQKEGLSQFSSHMWRVTAAVLLQQAGKDADYTKMRLRWAGESYSLYLRNTAILAKQHLAAVSAQDAHFVDAYQLDPSALPEQPLDEIAPIDHNGDDYQAF